MGYSEKLKYAEDVVKSMAEADFCFGNRCRDVHEFETRLRYKGINPAKSIDPAEVFYELYKEACDDAHDRFHREESKR